MSEGALAADTAQTHVYLGVGEGRFASRSTLKALSQLGIESTAVILPFHYLPCEPVNIERTLIEVPQLLSQKLTERAGTHGPVSLLGHSQGGGGIIIAASEAPELYNAVGAWSPVALTSKALGKELPEQRLEFFKRFLLQNSVRIEQIPLLHPGNLIAGLEIFSFIAHDAFGKRLIPKLNYALTVDGLDKITKLAQKLEHVAIFGAIHDPVFKITEYAEALAAVGLEHLLHIVPGSHSSPLTKPGQAQLEAVGAWLLGTRDHLAA